MASNEHPPVTVPPADGGSELKSRVAMIALVVAVLTLVVCSMEMVPDWGMMNLGWPRSTFYLIVAVVGTASGFLIGDVRLLGAIAGALSMTGALFATGLVLDNVNMISNVLLAIVGGIGALPGLFLYFAGAWLWRQIVGTAVSPVMDGNDDIPTVDAE